MSKPILCLDFDGVIHSYVSGWQGADVIPDPPVDGALQFIVDAMRHFTVAIYSSRSGQAGGISAMVQWLGRWSVDPVHGMPGDFDHGAWGSILWPTEKPAAFVSIDDRCLTFDGRWPPIEALKRFKPWNKGGLSGTDVQRFAAALRSIAASNCCVGCQEAALVAKAALDPSPVNTGGPLGLSMRDDRFGNEALLAKLASSDNREPFFVIRAQDVFSAHLVDAWCDLAVSARVPPEKVRNARACAIAMRNWPTKKVPD